MEEANENQIVPHLFTIPIIEIIRKLRTKIDRQNFASENSKYFHIIVRPYNL